MEEEEEVKEEEESMPVVQTRTAVLLRGRREDSCIRSGQEAAVGVMVEMQGGREERKVGADRIPSGDDMMEGEKDGGNIGRGVRSECMKGGVEEGGEEEEEKEDGHVRAHV